MFKHCNKIFKSINFRINSKLRFFRALCITSLSLHSRLHEYITSILYRVYRDLSTNELTEGLQWVKTNYFSMIEQEFFQ
jgi:hypothetical protein